MPVKKIGIVSLSSGILGEEIVQHEVVIGLERLKKMGLEVVFLPNALKGLDFIQQHPQARAQDLLDAFQDESIDLILCAIGGEDTYRLLPYLFENNQLKKKLQSKLFLGFSDTTINHLMLNKLGLPTYYGQAFLPDICELSSQMFPYSQDYFEELIMTGKIKEIRPSDVWYLEREDFSPKGIGVDMPSFENQGFELLKGPGRFKGKILGGCLESIYQLFDPYRFLDSVEIAGKYKIFPTLEEWKGKILFLETSEDKTSPTQYRKMIQSLKSYGVFNVITGLLVGKPQDETYYGEYKSILLEELSDLSLSIVYNLNVGHAKPRAILPLGIEAEIDMDEQVIRFHYEK